jgi:hypothetical protein
MSNNKTTTINSSFWMNLSAFRIVDFQLCQSMMLFSMAAKAVGVVGYCCSHPQLTQAMG